MQAGKWQELTEANCNQWTLDKFEVKKLAYLSKSNRFCLLFTQYAHSKNLYRGVSISTGTFDKISGDTSKWKHLLDSFDCDLRFSDCREIDKYFDWRMFWITHILNDECFDRQIFWFFALKQYLFNLKLKKNWKTFQLMVFKRMNWSNL